MTSKSSFFKLVLDEARRNLWALALSVLGFLFAAPLPLLIYIQHEMEQVGGYGVTEETVQKQIVGRLPWLLAGEQPFARLGMMTMAVLCGIVLFRFLHDRRQVDFYGALPIRREGLYAVKFTAGLLLVLPAYFASQAVAAAITAGAGAPIRWGAFLGCIGIDLLAFLTLYGIAILCTVLSGNTVFSAVLTGWSLVSVWLAAAVYDTFAQWYYPTYASGDSTGWLCPVWGFLESDRYGFGRSLLVYALVGAAALVLSFLLFRCRRGERAGMAVAFYPLRLPLKVYTCIVAGMGAACLMQSIIGTDSSLWLLLFVAVSAAVLHCVTEAVYDASARSIFRHPWTLLAVTAASLLLALGLKADVLGYSTWLPKESSIEYIELPSLYAQDGEAHSNFERYGGSGAQLRDPETVRAMLRLGEIGTGHIDLLICQRAGWSEQEAVLERRAQVGSYYNMEITYGLSGGRTERRNYCIPMEEETEGLFNTVLYSEDFLHYQNGAFRFAELQEKNPDLVPIAYVEDILRDTTVYTLRDAAQVETLVEALQADVLGFTPEQAAQEGPCAQIRLGLYTPGDSEKSVYTHSMVWVYPSYHRTLALLEESAGFTPEPLRADEVSLLTVHDGRVRSNSEADKESACTVSDPAQIRVLLSGLVDPDGDRYGLFFNSSVMVTVLFRNGNSTYLRYPAGKVPEDELARLFGSEVVSGNGPDAPGTVAAAPGTTVLTNQ